MKKKLLCAMCVLLSGLCLTTAALAAEVYGNIGELYQHWSMTRMPDWVCSVSSTDGSEERLTVVVTSSAAKEELMGMLTDTGTLTVVISEGGYSEKQLLQVMDEISAKYMGGGELTSVGVGWTTINGQVTGFGESGKESRVVVGVRTEYADEYRELFRKQYGDMVYVEVSEGIFTTTDLVVDDGVIREQLGIEQRNVPAWYLWGLAALLCGAVAAVLLRGRQAAAAVAADGRTVTAGCHLTARQVETLVAESTEMPDEETCRRILKQVKESRDS